MLREAGTHKTNMVHFNSTRSRRVCQSVLAAELNAFVDGFDVSIAINENMKTKTECTYLLLPYKVLNWGANGGKDNWYWKKGLLQSTASTCW